jgi:TonB family protein
MAKRAPEQPMAALAETLPSETASLEQQSTATSVAQYRQQLIGVAVRYKVYPPQAVQNAWEGDVALRVSIAASGAAQVSVRAGSGHELLDEQALEAFRLAAPQVPLPPALRGQEFGFEVRAVYALKD